MKQLKIEQIIPYLPYRLKVMMEGKVCNVAWMSTKNIAVKRPHTLIKKIKWEYAHLNVKPILRPLSDLAKEIEHNGEKFVPIDELTEGSAVSMNLPDYSSDWNERNYYSFERYLEEWLSGEEHHLYFFPFGFIQKLIEWHFDVYGLIEQGLAIEK